MDADKRKVFLSKIEEFIYNSTKETSFGDIDWSTIEVSKKVKFDSKVMEDEITEKCKHNHMLLIVNFCKHIGGLFPIIANEAKRTNRFDIIGNYRQYRKNIPQCLKNKHLRTFINTLGAQDSDH